MKFISSLVLTLALFSNASFASCEDGPYMAKDAALKFLKKKSPTYHSCKAGVSDPDNGTDVYTAIVNCISGPRRVVEILRVELQEIEDAVCYVKKVTRVAVSG